MSTRQHLSGITLISAVMMAATVVIHVYLGGPEVHDPLLVAIVNPKLDAFASVLWHAITIVLVMLTIGLAVLSVRQDRALEGLLACIQFGFAVLFIGYGLSRLGNLTDMPQWTIFLTIPLVTRLGQSLGARRSPEGRVQRTKARKDIDQRA